MFVASDVMWQATQLSDGLFSRRLANGSVQGLLVWWHFRQRSR
jgi:hypothetical protein